LPASSTRLHAARTSARRARLVALLLGAAALYGAMRASSVPELAGALFLSGTVFLVVAFAPRRVGEPRAMPDRGAGGG